MDYKAAVLLDLDGTLVDSVFHHVVTWHAALRGSGRTVPMWRIHQGIGMGSKRLVPWLLGEHVDDSDALSDEHERLFLDHAEDLVPTPGAAALIDDLDRRGVPFLVATSAGTAIREALLDVLGMPDLKTADADDVSSPKPAPDLLLAAAAQIGADPTQTTLVGDSPWDAEAADAIGMRAIAVRCGGFGDDRLIDGGAADVVDDPRALIGRL